MKTLIVIMVLLGQGAFAQNTLKLQRPANSKYKVCNAGPKKFYIKNADDQAACDQLRKPSTKGNINPPKEPIGSPNPITLPPTGN